jgi:hypothetical protein
MPTSNHNQIKNLFIVAIVLTVPLSVIGNNVSNASKSALKPGIIKCADLKLGDKGYVRGIVTKREKDKWTNQQVATLAESNSCETAIKFSPNSNVAGRFYPGNKLVVAVHVESEYQATLLNDDAKEDATILNLDGKLPATQTLVKRLDESLMPDKGKSLTIDYNYGYGNSYYFSKEAAAKLKPNVKQTWYFQEQSPKYFVVSNVETIEN